MKKVKGSRLTLRCEGGVCLSRERRKVALDGSQGGASLSVETSQLLTNTAHSVNSKNHSQQGACNDDTMRMRVRAMLSSLSSASSASAVYRADGSCSSGSVAHATSGVTGKMFWKTYSSYLSKLRSICFWNSCETRSTPCNR